MRYFKSPMPIAQINASLQHYNTHSSDDYCIIEIENKKALIICSDELVNTFLQADDKFKEINLSDIDLLTIPVLYKVLSVTGNETLFTNSINPHA